MRRKISKLDILSLAVGAIIGWGAFVLPGDLFIKEAGFINSSIGLLIGAVVMIIIEKNYGIMIKKCPVSGGEFAYTYKFFGRKNAFLSGWFLILAYLSIVPLNATALTLVFNSLSTGILKKGYLYSIAGEKIFLLEILISSSALILFAFFNIKGIKWASKIQIIMVLILVGIIFFMGGFVIFSKNIDKSNLYFQFKLESIKFKNILRILIISPWAYIGFDTIPQLAEEIDFPESQASKLAILSIIIGFIIYLIVNMLTAINFTTEVLNKNNIDWATGLSIEILFGKIGIYLLGIALLMAIIAGINGFYIATSRLIFSMARGKALPKYFEVLDPETNNPRNAIIFILLISLITPWFGRKVLIWIVDMSSVGAALGYFYTCLAVLKEGKSKNKIKYKIYGGLGSLFSLGFILCLLVPIFPGSLQIPSYIVLILWILLGSTFYAKISEKYNRIPAHKLDSLILKTK